MRRTRKIILIDEELCTGCGECVTACEEGALEVHTIGIAGGVRCDVASEARGEREGIAS